MTAQNLKLYYLPGACSLNLHILLALAKFTDVEYIQCAKSEKGLTVGDELLTKYNPKGRVPALQLADGKVLTEGAVIAQYIASLAPEAKLLPTEGDARWEALSLLNFCATDFHKGFSPLFKPYSSDEFKAAHKESDIARNLKYLNSLLEGKDFLLGSQFSAVDSYAYTVSRWGLFMKCDYSPYPNIAVWQKRVETLPAVQQALKEEGIPALY